MSSAICGHNFAVMPPPTIGNGTLHRLGALQTGGHRVLSLYLDLDPTAFPTPAAREAEISSLLAEARRQHAERDADRIQRLLAANGDLLRGARALAVFSSAAADVLETVKLSRRVEPMVVVDSVPWLEPLASLVASGDWGVAIVSRNAARLLRGSPRALAEFDGLLSDVHGQHSQGGWSQARYQRGIEEEVAAHVRQVAEHLLRAHRRRPFDHLVIVAAEELQGVIEHSLHSDLTKILTGFVDADLEQASEAEIAEAIQPVLEQAEREREERLMGELQEELATGGRAAGGLDEVLETLEADRVQTLLVADGASLHAGRCPRCGALYSDWNGTCRLDGAQLQKVDAAEHAVKAAAARSAQVLVVRREREALLERGGIAALLRW